MYVYIDVYVYIYCLAGLRHHTRQVVIKALMADLTPIDFKRVLTSCVCVYVCVCICVRERARKKKREKEKVSERESDGGSPNPYTNR